MSTRGYVGIRMNNEDKGGYNHFDSYPSGLGSEILIFLKNKTIQNISSIFNDIGNVETNEKEDSFDWRKHEINSKMEIYNSFLYDSLFCEYAYIINLDERVLEIYRGFNKDPNANGRYAKFKDEEDSVYYGVVLIQTISLEECFNGNWKVDNDDNFIKISWRAPNGKVADL